MTTTTPPTTPPGTDLPAQVGVGFVVGRFLRWVLDSSDEGEPPEWVSAGGSVTLTPASTLRRIDDPSAFLAGGSVTLKIDPVTGLLTDPQGRPRVVVPAGQYQVKPSVDLGLSGFTVEVTQAHTLDNPCDLAKAAPAPGPAPSPDQVARLVAVDAELLARIVALEKGGGGTGGAYDDTALRADLAAERSARESADVALSGRVDGLPTTAQVDARIEGVVGAAPAALDTLGEIADRLQAGDDTATALAAGLASETTARTAGDDALRTDLTGLDGRVDALAGFTDRVEALAGYTDRGDVTGAVNVVGRGTVALTLAGDTQMTLTGQDGDSVLIDADLAGHTLTVEGKAVGAVSVWARSRGRWISSSAITGGGGTGGAPDTTAPTAGTLAVGTTANAADLSVTGALDTGSGLDPEPYAFSRDGGATWTAWQAAATYRYTNLTASTTYSFVHRVRDFAGNIKTGATVSKATAAPPAGWNVQHTLDFTAADNTALTAYTADGATISKIDGTDGVIAGNRAASAVGNMGDFQIITAKVPKQRATADYDITNGNLYFGVRMFGWRSGISLNKNGNADALTWPFSTWILTWAKQTGHPKTGTIQVVADGPGKSFEVYINGGLILTATSAGYNGEACDGVRFMMQPDHQSRMSIDNLKLESST